MTSAPGNSKVPSLRVERYGLAALCAALVVSVAAPSRADDAESTAAARTLGIQGVQLADAGKCPEAIEKLQRAESLHHAPTILGRLGECQVAVGEVVQGTENLNSVVREPLASTAPQVYRDAQTRAQKVLASATPKIAYLTLKLDPPNAKANVTVGGKAVPSALIGAERPTDPGSTEVNATAPGYLPVKATVTLAEGAHEELALKLEKDPSYVAAGPATAAVTPVVVAPPPQSEPAPAPKKSHVAAYVAFGVGGAGLIVGTIAGVVAISKSGDCPSKLCKTQGDLDSLKSTATVSTIGFGVGVAGIAVGTILTVLSNNQESAQTSARLDRKQLDRKLTVQPWLGLNTAGVMGTFQ